MKSDFFFLWTFFLFQIIDANYNDFIKKISETKFINFPIYVSKNGSYHIIYEQFKKQVFLTMIQEEAFLLASILEKLVDLAFEACKFIFSYPIV